jgi:hypothetical protein
MVPVDHNMEELSAETLLLEAAVHHTAGVEPPLLTVVLAASPVLAWPLEHLLERKLLTVAVVLKTEVPFAETGLKADAAHSTVGVEALMLTVELDVKMVA